MSAEPTRTWVDNHCHIPPGSDGDAWVAAARSVGVSHLVTVGVTASRSAEAIEVARRHDRVYATVGVHPHDARDGMAGIAELVDDPTVVAVGEAGLDYFYDHSPRETQRDVFRRHIALAHDRKLPLVIHSRDAWEDTFAILDDEGVPSPTVLHCFTGGPDEARAGIDRGMFLSISGIVTFDNAEDLRSAVRESPLDRLMVETDSPYLTPVPKRGQRNEPANVVHVGEAVAELRGDDADRVAATTSNTAIEFYRLD